MRRAVAAISAAASLLISGCADDKCKSQPAQFQLTVRAGEIMPESIRSFRVALDLGGEHLTRRIDVDDELTDGQTSIAVRVEPAPTAKTQILITVFAYDEDNARGPPIAEANNRFMLTPDACNDYTLTLGPRGANPDAAVPDADPPAPDAEEDAGDAGVLVDPDGGVENMDASQCAQVPDQNTVALYLMEGNLSDETDDHDGARRGQNTTYSDGPPTCGNAFELPTSGTVQGYGRIEDSDEFDLAEGSIDLWILLDDDPPHGAALGVLSRDADGDARDGHFTLYLSCEGNVVAKLEDQGNTFYVCSNEVLARNTWAHITVNFGPPGLELYFDQNLGTSAAMLNVSSNCNAGAQVQCGGMTMGGIDDNANPWIIGASADQTNEGLGNFNDLRMPMRRGKIDNLRISSVRR